MADNNNDVEASSQPAVSASVENSQLVVPPAEQTSAPAATPIPASTNPSAPASSAPIQKLFVGQVPKTYWEDELRSLFEQCGTIRELKIIKQRPTGEHRGLLHMQFAMCSPCF